MQFSLRALLGLVVTIVLLLAAVSAIISNGYELADILHALSTPEMSFLIVIVVILVAADLTYTHLLKKLFSKIARCKYLKWLMLDRLPNDRL